ncbi:hypothetical protein GCM10009533_66950 [Saccharopolyspora spinosporotrichia]|uniref:Fungal-type protein kinase domain-containing protein n=1 Tax=Saccharopolyspora erythraea TaxID=1836 RepID=A0ABP3PBP8_SACER|nr:hypothetical protein N599_29565 [Saccharopolyspora erythraea D]
MVTGATQQSSASPGSTQSAAATWEPLVAANDAQRVANSYGAKLTNLITTVPKTQPSPGVCVWFLGTVIGAGERERAAIAWIIADSVMKNRAGSSRAGELWRSAALAGTRLSGRDRKIVSAFLDGVFGLPPDGKSEIHVIGHVAEWLWYLHARETVHGSRNIALLDPPKFNVTEPGGDGFVVFSDAVTSETSFRLWEIKQHVGGSAVSTTVGTAYKQLSTNATRYLAQLTGIHSTQPGPVGELCQQLVDFWIDCSHRAGAGVSVASATTPAPPRCFSTMGRHFPGFTQPGQMEGLLMAVEDLPGLARDVRGYLWTVL